MSQNVTELEDGSVVVRVRSRRGTDTRDQDEVTIEGVFDDLDQAESQSERINQLVQERMADARKVTSSGLLTESAQDKSEISQVYLGEGSNLSGWIDLPREIVFEQIAPLASQNIVDGDNLPGIKLNFSEDVPNSGWQEVDAEIVSKEIEPIVRKHRLNRE
jgi:hypothetical protein